MPRSTSALPVRGGALLPVVLLPLVSCGDAKEASMELMSTETLEVSAVIGGGPGTHYVRSVSVRTLGGGTVASAELSIFYDANGDTRPDPDEVVARTRFEGAQDLVTLPGTDGPSDRAGALLWELSAHTDGDESFTRSGLVPLP